jgi:hypothetical protein
VPNRSASLTRADARVGKESKNKRVSQTGSRMVCVACVSVQCPAGCCARVDRAWRALYLFGFFLTLLASWLLRDELEAGAGLLPAMRGCREVDHPGRGLHSFPVPLNFLSLLCPFPLNLSLLCPRHNPN